MCIYEELPYRLIIRETGVWSSHRNELAMIDVTRRWWTIRETRMDANVAIMEVQK
jgi:hypothetical protein